MLHSNFSKFGALKVYKITLSLASFWVGHLNVAYMTNFSKKLNFYFSTWPRLFEKWVTLSTG